MPFTTDGRVHRSGISNEHAICNFLNTKSIVIRAALCPAGSTVEHRGGTGSKADAEIVLPAHAGAEAGAGEEAASKNKTISIKHHKMGTFDWLNSSAAIPVALKATLHTALQAIRATYDASTKVDADEKTARVSVENLFAEHLRALPSNSIKALLSGCYAIYTDYIIIKDVAKNELVAFDRSKNIPELRTFDSCSYYLKSSARAKTSAQIWRRHETDGLEMNTKLRLRLVLNNGVSALLGKSVSNKCSVPCLKIQQDDVSHFLTSLTDPWKETYEDEPPAAASAEVAVVATPSIALRDEVT